MAMAAILVMWPGPFEQTFVPPSHRSSIWNLTLIGPVVSEKMFTECGRQTTTYDGRTTAAYLSHKLTIWAFGSGELTRNRKNNTARSRLSKILTPIDKSGHNVMSVNCVKPLVIHRRYIDNDVLIWSSSKRRRFRTSKVLGSWSHGHMYIWTFYLCLLWRFPGGNIKQKHESVQNVVKM